ncbi:cytochrome P450 [Xylaria digitata]|nr:cytochrome P450 [Xylaria digitata]
MDANITILGESTWRSLSVLALNSSFYVPIFFGASCIYILSLYRSHFDNFKPPLVGRKSIYEPEWSVGFRFLRNASSIIQRGYDQFKHQVFRIRRIDGDIFVIPSENLDRFRNAPEEEVNGLEAHIKNLFGPYSTTDMMLDSDLPTRVIQQKLTPSLTSVVSTMKDEIDHALEIEVPNCQDEWVPVQAFDLLSRIIARVSTRVFLGQEICRNEEWYVVSMRYMENVYMLIKSMRMIPPSLHPFLSPLLPSYWRVRSSLRDGKRFMRPFIQERLSEARNSMGQQKSPDLLQWMIEIGFPNELIPDKLAHRQLLMNLAATHTTGMAATHVLYDLCAQPEYLQQIREELIEVLSKHGGWHKSIIPKFRKLDSFMKESQRLNPPALIAFNRIARVELTLVDGTKLPSGTHFCMASDAISHDKAYIPGEGDPDAFQPLRWFQLRNDPSDPDNSHRYQFATTDSTSLHFGHGKFACPGRFFAGQLIKMIIGHLLLQYDFKYPEGLGRPKNCYFDENISPDPSARVLIRRRKSSADGKSW